MVAHVYEKTFLNSGLRRLIVAWLGWKTELEVFRSPENHEWLKNHGEIAADLAAGWSYRFDTLTQDPFSEYSFIDKYVVVRQFCDQV